MVGFERIFFTELVRNHSVFILYLVININCKIYALERVISTMQFVENLKLALLAEYDVIEIPQPTSC
jgi:hypothetical protein